MWNSSASTRDMLESFLGRRQLELPDGRPLYAYRCTQNEFADFVERLRTVARDEGRNQWSVRVFVLYASEWWQRQYDGGRWAWEPLLRFVGWDSVHFPELYEPVRKAFRWWEVELVRMHNTRYLGTFACQGGLPLALSGETHAVPAYLRALLRHARRYRQFVEDTIELARDQQYLLRPPTLRREYVFRLAADLIDTVLDLHDDVDGDHDLERLDSRRPRWRESMPLDLDDERARQLLRQLLRDAKTGPSTVNAFTTERFLSRTAAGWRLGARIHLPRSLSRDALASHLKIPESALLSRMHVRTIGQNSRVIGLYAAGGEQFHLVPVDRNQAVSFWDDDAMGEFRLEFYAQEVVGTAVVRRGGMLGSLPWTFRDEDGECSFIAEGSVSDRAPKLLVALSEECTSSGGQALNECVVGRNLMRVMEPILINTCSGTCRVNPSSEQMKEEDYWLIGARFNELRSHYTLYRGAPRLAVARANDRLRTVPANEVNWRSNGREWLQQPDGFGLWEVRHIRAGVLRHREHIGLIPDSLKLTVQTNSNSSTGELLLSETQGVRVSDDGSDARLDISSTSDCVLVHASTPVDFNPPAELSLRLHWSRTRELSVFAPFPVESGWFLKNDLPVGKSLSIDEIFGVRAIALSTDDLQRFWIEGELKAEDTMPIRNVAFFRRNLRKAGIRHELALIELEPMLQLLLGASASSDAKVSVSLIGPGQTVYAEVEVVRFSGKIEHDSYTGDVLFSLPLEQDCDSKLEAISLARADQDPVALPITASSAISFSSLVPRTLQLDDGPWCVVLRQDESIRIEPARIGGRQASDFAVGDHLSLNAALSLSDPSVSIEQATKALFEMLNEKDKQRIENDWSYLTDMMLSLDGIPSTVAVLHVALARCPQMLVRCLFRFDEGLRGRIWRLEDELPFSWLLISRWIWRGEAQLASKVFATDLAEVKDAQRIAREFVIGVLEEGTRRLGGLDSISADVRLALTGDTLSEAHELEYQAKRDQKTQEHINFCGSQDDWPVGNGRREWSEEIDRGELLSQLKIWQINDLHPAHRPTFDTPIAASWCCFSSSPSKRTTFLVKRMRAHAAGLVRRCI